MTTMKKNLFFPGLCFIALAIVLAGCHHKISPVARSTQGPTAEFPASAIANLLVNDRPSPDPDWSNLNAAMERMHTATGSVKPSGNSDRDFVRLMLPHHQAAIDMARAQLLYGKDPQMRRLAQEIITDQQSEIELMQLWLTEDGRQK